MDLTTETDRERLERALDADPQAVGLRRALADLLEESREDQAAWGQRWQASSRKFPLYNSALVSEGLPWSWWRAHDRQPYFRLPARVLVLLADGTSCATRPFGTWRGYPTRAAAEADLARALSLLPDRGASLLPETVDSDSPGRSA
jgi:hypothetical protein